MKYNKLVRDKIPETIRKQGRMPVTHIADGMEYLEKLKEKLVEEANEFSKNENDEELADIIEVMNAICDFKGINRNGLEILRKKKVEERGSFIKRIILDEIE